MRFLKTFLLLTVTSCTHPLQALQANLDDSQTESQRLNAWFDQEFERSRDLMPEYRTRLGDKRDNDKLGDASEAAADPRLDAHRQSVATMRTEFDHDLLDEEARTSYDLYVYRLEIWERCVPFRRKG